MGDEWGTPQKLFDEINKKSMGITLDVCASSENKKVEAYFDKKMDGLKQKWEGVCWCNPPYSNIEPWVNKAIEETQSGPHTIVYMLLPVNTDTQYFKKVLENACEIMFITGRLTFEGEQNYPARFPSCIAIFDNRFDWSCPNYWLMDRDTFQIKKVSL